MVFFSLLFSFLPSDLGFCTINDNTTSKTNTNKEQSNKGDSKNDPNKSVYIIILTDAPLTVIMRSFNPSGKTDETHA